MIKKGIEYIFSNKKIVKSGSLVEIYDFGKEFVIGKSQKIIKTKNKRQPSEKDKEEALQSSARRAKRTIKRLINANSFLWFKKNGKYYLPITLTLTFANNVSDIKTANYEFTKFILRLNYEVFKSEDNKLKYLSVYELQKRGAIHYHMIFFNLPYIKDIYNKMRDIWKQGRIMVGGKDKRFKQIKTMEHLKKTIDYFTKYIQKSFLENQFPNKKKYTASKGLLKPIENSFPETVNLIKSKLPENSLVYKYNGEEDYNKSKNNENSFLKWFNYSQFDLSKYPEIDSEISIYITNYNNGSVDNIDL